MYFNITKRFIKFLKIWTILNDLNCFKGSGTRHSISIRTISSVFCVAPSFVASNHMVWIDNMDWICRVQAPDHDNLYLDSSHFESPAGLVNLPSWVINYP